MKPNTNEAPPPLREVLYEFALAVQPLDGSLLSDFLRRYPQYADELTGLAVELSLDASASAIPSLSASGYEDGAKSPEVLRMVSLFQNRLHSVKEGGQAAPVDNAVTNPNPFAFLGKSEMRQLARDLNANSVFMMKLRDCQILYESMSEGFIGTLCSLLNTGREKLAAHFSCGVQLREQTQYKADQKPHVGEKQTFEDAVTSSGLTLEQQSYLLGL